MELNVRHFRLGFFLILLVVSIGFTPIKPNIGTLTGAWQFKDETVEQVVIITEKYFTYTCYDKINKKFISSHGGTYELHDNHLMSTIEFNTDQKEKVGQTDLYTFSVDGDQLSLDVDGKKLSFSRIDDGSGALAGAWVITGRIQGDSMITITPGARKTLKIMSGTRFQWAAINTETNEFFGTGGGTYTFVDGKYTETIEFFSRDNSRVGMSLSFDGKLVEGKWHHSGLSSRGGNIHEIWSRL